MNRFARRLALLLALAPWLAQAGALQVSVLDKDGKPVPDAVVVLVPSQAGTRAPLPTQVTVVQEKMRFLPPVALVAAGGQASFVNNDPWEHHVRGTAAGVHNFDEARSGGFELRLDGKAEGKPGKVAAVNLDKAGPVLLGCHLHASMRAHIFVSDTPWAAISSVEGVASFDAVPDGPVRIRVWHADQLIDVPTQQVTLTAAAAKATMQLTVVPRRRRV